jgi:hypothetical protein
VLLHRIFFFFGISCYAVENTKHKQVHLPYTQNTKHNLTVTFF